MKTAAALVLILGFGALFLAARPGRKRPPAPPDRDALLLASALACLALPFLVQLLSLVSSVLSADWGRALLPLALAGTLALHLALFRGRLSGAALWAPPALLAAVLLAGLWAGGLYFDASYDGKAYHQEAILAFLSGLNPLEQIYPGNHWVDDYPKLSWILSAALAHWTPSLQNAKGMQFLFLAGNLLALLRLFLAEGRGRRLTPALFALALAANPVVLSQLFTFYVDAALYALVCVLAAQAVVLARRRGRALPADWVLAAVAGALCANLKFTGLVYGAGVLFCLFAFALAFSRRALLPRATALGLAVLLLSLGLGANPYLNNLLQGRHLFHPLMGAQKGRSIIDHFRPPYMTGENRVKNLLVSSFSRVRIVDRNPAPTLENPFDFAGRLGEFREMEVPDPRVGGFGPYMGAALLLSAGLAGLLLLPGGRPLRRGRGKYALLLAAAVLGTTLANPEPWWARYSPQFWMAWAPLALWLPVRRTACALPAKALAAALLAVCLADSALTLHTVLRRQEQVTDIVRLNLAEARHFRRPAVYLTADRFALSAELLLRENGIPFVYADKPPRRADNLLFFNEDDGFLLFDLDSEEGAP